MNHLALFLLLPAAWLTWRWSRLVSCALWLTLATWLAYRGVKWQWPDAWAAGHFEWMRGVSMVTGLVGAIEIAHRVKMRTAREEDLDHGVRLLMIGGTFKTMSAARLAMSRAWIERHAKGRPDILAALLVASMGVDLAALLIHRVVGQWGPQPFFQCIVLVAMCVVAWPRRAL
jgi:hypothetical protein